MTWTFNILTIVNDLLFAFVLHKISKRLPIPFQWEDDDQDAKQIINDQKLKGSLHLQPLNRKDIEEIITEEEIVFNFNENKYINFCCICNYKLIQPTYPSYYFEDITPDRRKELLENHWKTLQDQTPDDSTLVSPSSKSPTSKSVKIRIVQTIEISCST